MHFLILLNSNYIIFFSSMSCIRIQSLIPILFFFFSNSLLLLLSLFFLLYESSLKNKRGGIEFNLTATFTFYAEDFTHFNGEEDWRRARAPPPRAANTGSAETRPEERIPDARVEGSRGREMMHLT
ncbi:hypothetical protein PUN28_011085 [Cardiocondyla obscurior]|uniref:Uncharacterized protein n=1 Tax=Cardiocondyla obscurior TaxID=286306 RepID=A0AAW2FMN4_9HYME